MAQLPPESVDVVVTSPPYNLGVKYSSYKDDQQREKQIRAHPKNDDEMVLLRLLDEARIEITGLREALAAHQDELGITMPSAEVF